MLRAFSYSCNYCQASYIPELGLLVITSYDWGRDGFMGCCQPLCLRHIDILGFKLTKFSTEQTEAKKKNELLDNIKLSWSKTSEVTTLLFIIQATVTKLKTQSHEELNLTGI